MPTKTTTGGPDSLPSKQQIKDSPDRAQVDHEAEANKGDSSLSVNGSTSASVYDRRDISEDANKRQDGRSSSAHPHEDETTLSTMGDNSESVYDQVVEGVVGGLQISPDEQRKSATKLPQEEGPPRDGETEAQRELPKAAK